MHAILVAIAGRYWLRDIFCIYASSPLDRIIRCEQAQRDVTSPAKLAADIMDLTAVVRLVADKMIRLSASFIKA